jgi:DNA-binding SARP family transcriptional activator
MSAIHFHLFGKFSGERDSRLLKGLEASKEQELLSYLLIHRERPHARETLAGLLWADTSTERSKKYLRQALWHLHSVLSCDGLGIPGVLQVDHDWVQLNPKHDLWLDVAEFEQAFALAKGVPGRQLERPTAEALQNAVQLYKGDLLDGCYQDWCLYERERLQNMYLSILDKLVDYSKERRDYERGQLYCSTILRYDRARERTHRQLMYVQYLAGDRTAALRQYKRCVAALDEELGVSPESRTMALYEKIRADQIAEGESIENDRTCAAKSLPEVLGRLQKLHAILAAVKRRVQRDIKAVELGIKAEKH